MRSPLLVSLLAAARIGAEILVDRFARLGELVVTEKGPSDFVSAADMASEEAIKRALVAAHPGARFQAEETTENRVTQGARFIIDPLDGTTNFLHGIPHFAISIAFWDDAGAVAGVVLDPCRDEAFFAERGDTFVPWQQPLGDDDTHLRDTASPFPNDPRFAHPPTL